MAQDQEEAVAIDIDEAVLSSTIKSNISALHRKPMAPESFTIFRVPARVRQRSTDLYEPRMVSIGPYGRCEGPIPRAMEQHKWRYLQDFLSRNPYISIEDYIAEIRELEPEARRRYFEPVELSAEKFVEMLLLDGCFVLEFIMKWGQGDVDSVSTAGWSLLLVRGDLFLLENQIPLFVLEKLFEVLTFTMDGNIPSLMELLVNYLARENVECPKEEVEGNNNRAVIVFGEAKEFHHLLHLYYHCYFTKPETARTGSSKRRSPRPIPSATMLLKAGVTIKKNQNQNQNRFSSFLDVTFSQGYGVLEIPFLSVENSTLSRFTNLVAFEQCGGCKPEEAYMTSYAVFMDCLIDTPEDVAVLRERGILENNLASDKELAVFFNQLSDCAALDYENHYLAGLFQDVGEYCDSAWPKLRVTLVRDYFGSRWSFLSFLGAVTALLFTIIQTFFTVYPKK